MKPVLLIDFGSTYTKVTAADAEGATLLGTAASFTTAATDVNEGLARALAQLEQTTGPLDYTARLACSSAAGGLRMVTCGLVPELTAEAARLASLGAGAKVVKVYAFQLTEADVAEIAALRPDILLLTGGTDGGNTQCMQHNAHMLAAGSGRYPVVLAGNRIAAQACQTALAGWEVTVCDNVMPRLGQLNTKPVQSVIRELFLKRIIHAKGLSQAQDVISGILMPTPAAMLQAMELLAGGTDESPGLGDLLAVDLGGATTDVYSMARGLPKTDNTILKGLPEPYAKRTVEGDIGMRYGAAGVLAAAGADTLGTLAGLEPEEMTDAVAQVAAAPYHLPQTPREEAVDYALACAAVDTAVTRHAGRLEEVYTPMGLAYAQTGKDLTEVRQLVLTGGAIIHNPRAAQIAAHALHRPATPNVLKPKHATVYVDEQYILAAMGLLAQHSPTAALTIMKKELRKHGTGQ